MRKITPTQILVFSILLGTTILLSIASDLWLLGGLKLGDFRSVILTLGGLLLLYAYAILTYRIFMAMVPLLSGDISPGSPQEFVYQVHLLFFLMLFYPVMRSGFIPVPIMRLFYQSLGARLGRNSFSAGILYDPHFIRIGDNTLVGQGALLIPHALEGMHLSHQPITLGNNVTIGAYAIVLGGACIDDGGLLAAGSVLGKGAHVGPDEIWAGVPARMIKRR